MNATTSPTTGIPNLYVALSTGLRSQSLHLSESNGTAAMIDKGLPLGTGEMWDAPLANTSAPAADLRRAVGALLAVDAGTPGPGRFVVGVDSGSLLQVGDLDAVQPTRHWRVPDSAAASPQVTAVLAAFAPVRDAVRQGERLL